MLAVFFLCSSTKNYINLSFHFCRSDDPIKIKTAMEKKKCTDLATDGTKTLTVLTKCNFPDLKIETSTRFGNFRVISG